MYYFLDAVRRGILTGVVYGGMYVFFSQTFPNGTSQLRITASALGIAVIFWTIDTILLNWNRNHI